MSANKHDGHAPKMRVEDARLVTGGGKFAADWDEPAQLYGQFVRSDRAHAEIVSVNADGALRLAGVKAVLTGADAVRGELVLVERFVEEAARVAEHLRFDDDAAGQIGSMIFKR